MTKYNPRSPRPQARGPRPNAWITGPDPLEHKKYRAFIQHKNQSNYRNEPWTLTFDEYKELWAEHWFKRGRTHDCYCLTRRDYSLPWNKDNAEVITRYEHNRRQISQVGRRRRKKADLD